MEKSTTADELLDHPIRQIELDKVRGRSLWVDYAKGIGIILVVYGHVAHGIFNAGINMDKNLFMLVESVIYSFHMPLFFFLSGLFFLASMERRGSVSLLRSKLDTILYPYVIWSLLQGMVEVAMSHYVNGHTTVVQVLSLAWSPRAQFWFLYILFFAFALATLLFRRSSIFWGCSIFIGSIFFYYFGWILPNIYLINMLSHFFVYFTAGVFAAFLLCKFNSFETKWLIPFLALFVYSQWIFHVELGLNYVSTAALEKLLLGLISVGFVVFLAQWLTRFNLRWMAYLGQQSMTIYLVHILAGSGCRIVLQKVLGITDVGVHLLVGTLAGLLLPILFYFVCTRIGLSALFSPPKMLSFGSEH
ncbi:MAG: acyltransferase [Sideroxyarcus sp.]